jgi:class 3 adenylate cyclase
VTELPTGTVTFLFTDLERSTRLWEDHPEAMHAALARHDEILRDAIAAHSGHLVKMTGDGAHGAFATADSAARAALDAQRALASEPWPHTGELRVRMGIHTGPAVRRDGDYYGTALNRAARLMSVAHGRRSTGWTQRAPSAGRSCSPPAAAVAMTRGDGESAKRLVRGHG